MLRHPIWNSFAQFLFFFSARLLLIYLFTCLRLLEEKKRKKRKFVSVESVYMFISVRTGNPWIT
jgi:hypothetical protein